MLDEYGVKADEMQWIETTESSDGAKLSPKLNRYFLTESLRRPGNHYIVKNHIAVGDPGF
ncbi:MAG: hypothetical protein DRQ60_03360 [Gammaproteobacteria bacterium]|nr:MAG: hypothetical protein DRQ52_05585 [Gammaproteobacteria bacterium]RLA16907.1 MAG: hypothetical protein DRQ60_03360 [Gammaproteobacteria bacterium]